jgi:hypothetical protein
MPIKKEYCDAWYAACKDDYFCFDATAGDSSWFSHPALHAKGLCTAASGNCKTFSAVFGTHICPSKILQRLLVHGLRCHAISRCMIHGGASFRVPVKMSNAGMQ